MHWLGILLWTVYKKKLTVNNTSQSDFETILKTNKYKVGFVSIDVPLNVFYDLYNEYLKITSNEKELKRQVKRLDSIAKNITKYALNTKLSNLMYYEMAQADLEAIERESKSENVDAYPYIIEKYGFIDKKKISVFDFHSLYKTLLEAK